MPNLQQTEGSDRVEKFFNRDLSWLEFNRRVLYQALDSRTPLLERLRFLSIFTNNLDEFFMKRVGHLKRIMAQGVQKPGHTHISPARLFKEIREIVLPMLQMQDQCYLTEILPALRENGIYLLNWTDLNDTEKKKLKEYFNSKVFPVLTPLAVDPAHPFPFLSNLSVSLGIKLRHPKRKDSLFARLKIPDVLPQWVRLESSEGDYPIRFVRLQDIIQNNLEELFPEMVIEKVMPFRVTRSVDINQVDDEGDDLMDLVEEELRLRRTADIVRLEHIEQVDPWMMNLLQYELDLETDDFYGTSGEMNYRTLSEIADLDIPKLRFEPWSPVVPTRLSEEDKDIFRALQEGDILVHHPYDSFNATVEKFIRAACEDPKVLAIKITLYRAGGNSPLIPLLIKAAEKGKQIVCVVELKARFDEATNIYWGELLEEAGVHVVYGLVGLKTHSKIALIVRKEQEDFKFYAHIGTGNYNVATAKLYTDFGLLTADKTLTSEVIEIFNYLTGLSLKKNYKKFLVAPINMRESFVSMLEKEIENHQKGKPAGVVAQMNSLEDHAMCEALYTASQAGVPILLIVRGLCCLRPGVPSLSENIKVISILGRFLEHSRLYYFRNGGKKEVDGKFFIGSADWMQRNLSNRVETVLNVEDKQAKEYLWTYLQVVLNDQRQAWELGSDGKYTQRMGPEPNIGSHATLMKLAIERSKRIGGRTSLA